jgi:hypothetical protein
MDYRPHGPTLAIIPKRTKLDWTHSADGRPSGSSLQAVEQQVNLMKHEMNPK